MLRTSDLGRTDGQKDGKTDRWMDRLIIIGHPQSGALMKVKVSKLTYPILPHYLTMLPILNGKICIKYIK